MKGHVLSNHVLSHQGFDLRPEAGIALALHVVRGEDPVDPGSLRALHGSFAVIDAVVPQYVSFGGIGGHDLRAAMDQTVRLVKIYGLGNVAGYHGIVLPKLGDAIDLYRKQDRDAIPLQIAGKHDRCGSSPTLAEQDNACPCLFLRRQKAVPIAIE